MIVRTRCDVTRRNLLLGTAAVTGIAVGRAQQQPASVAPADEMNKVAILSDGAYFHQGDLEHQGHCNNGWIVFRDYVLLVDANFPSGADLILPKIRSITAKPIRFAFDTHHHGDHTYGNQVWVDNGATPVAHTGVIEEMKRYETGYYGGQPGRWEATAKTRPDVAASHLKPPSVLFPRELYFDDGEHRVELLHLGVAHTHGDAVAWLPKERVLFTGDTCVNGPYNFVGDGDVEKWIATLGAARKLGAKVVCPGHGPKADATLLEDQQMFFAELRERVGALVQAKKSPREIYQSMDQIRGGLVALARIARYVSKDGLPAQVEKVCKEMTGQGFPEDVKAAKAARLHHRHAHSLADVGCAGLA
jgi:glyoxylase-like metal-dependent hydrolase (beta-lactamase superfamily II)